MIFKYQQAIDQHRQRIYSFAHYSLRAAEDAEDVTQEVFIKLWQHWQKIDHNKLGAWLMRVAHNAVIDHVRKHKSVRENVDHFADVELAPDDHDASGDIDQDRFKRYLEVAIKGLDDPFKSIIIMRDIQGLSYAEIEETLGMSESQVKVYLHRGRRKLREHSGLRKLYESISGGRSNSAAGTETDEGSKHG